MIWPNILGEYLTVNLLVEGYSISRFGDGELNLCLGGLCITQPYSERLSVRLKKILKEPLDKCLVGLPRQDGPKANFWNKYNRKEIINLFKEDHHYASSFITRPDSAPWIDTSNYWNMIRSLWYDRDIILVRGSEKSLTKEMLPNARSVNEIIVQKKNAFVDYDSLINRVWHLSPNLVLLCLGPTATVMAHDLCKMGIQALDLGHLGMFLKKHDQGLPMIVTQEDKNVDRYEALA